MARAQKLSLEQLRRSVELKKQIAMLEKQFNAVISGKNLSKVIGKQRVSAASRARV